jgi:hypothetical protein
MHVVALFRETGRPFQSDAPQSSLLLLRPAI